jgi:iron-sulfur cluster insertion protein
MTHPTNANDQPTDPVTVTPSAILKIYELMQEEGNLNLKLRIFITGGGCSGFQYGFSFEEGTEINADDIVIEKKVPTIANDANPHPQNNDKQPFITVLVDGLSLQYLAGAEVDYLKDINGEHFRIRGNPNAKTTCGCGSSFSADVKNDA